MPKHALAINSVLIVILSSIVGIVLHELAHYVVGWYFNLQPELHHNYVSAKVQGTELQHVIMAAAGPIFSLLFGILMLAMSKSYLKPSLFKLFITWLGMGSLLTFFGYMMIAPFIKQGDTGKVFSYIGVPFVIGVVIAILSFIYVNWLFGKQAHLFRFYKSAGDFTMPETSKALFIIPIFASIIVMTLLNLPVIIWVSLLPTICMPLTYFSTYGEYKNLSQEPVATIDRVSPILIVATIISICIFRFLV